MLGATQKQLFNMDGNEITGFKPYQAYSKDPNDYVAGFSPLQQQAQQATGQLGVPSQYGQATQMTGMAGLGSLGLAGQMAGAGQNFAQQAQDPRAMQGYMSPYMQNVVDYQKSQALRDYNLGTGVRKAQATGAGAFGGNRQALMEAEAQRSLGNQLQGITAQGSQQAFQDAQKQQQFGAQLGLQGQQGAMQGLGQYGAMGAQLGQLGGQQLKSQQEIIQAQYGMGQQQQAQEQQKINQAMQDWANTQQYPLMQLGVMSNMLRGLPMQASTTNQYQAAPNALTQGIGAAGAGASLYNALRGRKGGLPSEFESSKTGIKSYYEGDVVESTKSDLYDLPLEELEKRAKSSTSPTIKRLATAIAKEKRMGLAGGGIIAFQNRGLVPEPISAETEERVNQAAVNQAYIDAARMQAGNPPILETSAPYVPTDRHIPLTERIGRALGIKDAGRQVPTKETTTMPMRSDGSDVPMVAGSSELTAAQKAPVNSKSVVAAAPAQRIDSDVPTVAKSDLPPMPTNVKADDKGRTDANKQGDKPTKQESKPSGIKEAAPADKKTVATTDNRGVGIVPNTGLAPDIGGIKLPTRPVEETQEELDKGAAARVKAFGIDPKRAEERAGLISERANNKEEARRAQALRFAEFFAAWGSTPGSTISAGLRALETKVPGLVTDAREEAKIRRAINKDIAALDKLQREEELGIKKDYYKERSDLAKRAKDTYGMDIQAYSSVFGAVTNASSRIEAARVGQSNRDGANSGKDLRFYEKEISDLDKNYTNLTTGKNTPYVNDQRLIDVNKEKAAKGELSGAVKNIYEAAVERKKIEDDKYRTRKAELVAERDRLLGNKPTASASTELPAGAEPGSKLVGTAKGTGDKVYERPDGSRYIIK
jgi:hypothetical protein